MKSNSRNQTPGTRATEETRGLGGGLAAGPARAVAAPTVPRAPTLLASWRGGGET